MGSVNSTTTSGLSNSYELLVELKGEKVAIEFSAAFEGCWSNARTSDVSAAALDTFIAQAAARKQPRGRGIGSVQLGFPSESDHNLEDPTDPDEDSRTKNTESKPKRSLK